MGPVPPVVGLAWPGMGEGTESDRGRSWPAALCAAGVMATVLLATANGYGYHRDELYFRLLPTAWGHVDQPPLTPALARLSVHVADQPCALRLPAVLAAVLTVLLAAQLTSCLGGGRLAQGLAVWGVAFGTLPLGFGHVLLTASLDLPIWLGILGAVARAVQGSPRWWLLAGLLVGVATWNRWLVVVLVGGVVLGLLVLGPRAALVSRWPWLGGSLALFVAAPNLAYQAAHGWPQLAMGEALRAGNEGEVRTTMWLLLLVGLGPPLAVISVLGLVGLVRQARWRAVRFLVVVLGVLVAFTWVAGTQPYYPLGALVPVFCAGCVVVADAAVRRAWVRVAAVGAVALNAVVASVISLPVIPVTALGATPVPAMNQLVADQVGWPAHVRTVATAYDRAVEEAAGAPVAIIATNYGEAGAIARYGPDLGLPTPFSGHNALAEGPRPAASTVVVVGSQSRLAATLFATCVPVGTLDNGVGVDNEEQGEPITICRGPLESWDRLWPRFRHLD